MQLSCTKRASGPSPELLDDSQSMVGVVQTPSAVFGHRDDVLDADAESPGEINAGLDGEAHARHERLLLAFDHVRRLVSGQSDAVARAMNELLAEASIRDDPSGRPIDLLTAHSGTNRIDTGLLCKPHHLMDLPDLRSRFPHADRTRGI